MPNPEITPEDRELLIALFDLGPEVANELRMATRDHHPQIEPRLRLIAEFRRNSRLQ